MLENTFIHLPNFGPTRERKLWSRGILSWDDFLGRFGSSNYHRDWCSRIAGCKYALKEGDPKHFAKVLPSSEKWRAFPHFTKRAYLDIETTGLSAEGDHVTVIGLYDGEDTKSFIWGKNLDGFRDEISKYDMVVTFNGSMFDVPFLNKSMKGLEIPPLHMDLRFVLSSIDVTGGLKRIEKRFGLEREDDLAGLTGYDAVKLWRRYRNGEERALDTLVRYNAADISSLKVLAEWAYKEKRKRTGIDSSRSQRR